MQENNPNGLLDRDELTIEDPLEAADISDDLRALSQEITTRREAIRLNKTELSKKLGCHASFLAKLENIKWDSPLPSYALTCKMEKEFRMEKGQLWSVVEIARSEIERNKLLQKARRNQCERGLQSLDSQMAPVLKALDSVQPTKVSAAAKQAVKALIPELLIAMNDPSDRALIEMMVRGLTARRRQNVQ